MENKLPLVRKMGNQLPLVRKKMEGKVLCNVSENEDTVVEEQRTRWWNLCELCSVLLDIPLAVGPGDGFPSVNEESETERVRKCSR